MLLYQSKKYQWRNQTQLLTSVDVRCGHCGLSYFTKEAYWGEVPENSTQFANIYICPSCRMPTLVQYETVSHDDRELMWNRRDWLQQTPKYEDLPKLGPLPKHVAHVRSEIEIARKNRCLVSVLLLARILIMHVAEHLCDFAVSYDPSKFPDLARIFDKNTRKRSIQFQNLTRRNFSDYLTYLENLNFLPRGSRGLINKVKELGNSTNHSIYIPTDAEAGNAVSTCDLLLQNVYGIGMDWDDDKTGKVVDHFPIEIPTPGRPYDGS